MSRKSTTDLFAWQPWMTGLRHTSAHDPLMLAN